jgi:hypothetical protein
MIDAATERRSAKSTGRKVSDATISLRADVGFLSPARQSRRIRGTSDSERPIDRCHMLCYKQLFIDTGCRSEIATTTLRRHLIST